MALLVSQEELWKTLLTQPARHELLAGESGFAAMATTSWGEVLGTVASQLGFLPAGEQQSTQQPAAESDGASASAPNRIGVGSPARETGQHHPAGPEAVPASQRGTCSIRPMPGDGTDGDVVDLRGRLHLDRPAASSQQLLLHSAEEVSVPSMFLLGSQQAAGPQQQQCLEQQLGPAATSSRGRPELRPARVCLTLVGQAAGPRGRAATAECELLLPDVLEVRLYSMAGLQGVAHWPNGMLCLLAVYGLGQPTHSSSRMLACR